MKKNRFKHCLLILLVLAFSSSVAAQDQQFTVEQLVAKADEAIDKDDYKEAAKWTRMAVEKGSHLAMFRLGEMYYLRGLTKRGLPDDKKELNGEVVDFDKDDGLNSFAEAQKWFNKTIETCDRILEDATTIPTAKMAAVIGKGNAEKYLEIVKKAIDRGK